MYYSNKRVESLSLLQLYCISFSYRKSLAHLEPEGFAAMSPILEDPVRKQIAIQFRQLYDHNRAAAFTDLITIGALFEDAAVRILCEMLKV